MFEAQREQLLQEQAQLAQALAQAKLATAVVELDQSSMGRVSRIDLQQQQALAINLLERQRLRQRKIEAALARFAAGTYGLCCTCQEALSAGRLQADAAAVFCQACADER